MRAACPALLLFLVPPITFLICGVVVAVDVIDAKAIAVLCSTTTTRFLWLCGFLQGSKLANGVMAEYKELTWKSFLTASCAFAIATVCFHLAWMRNACAYIVSQYNTKAPSIDSLLLFLDFKTTPAVTAQMKRPRGSRLNDFYYSWACRQRLFCDRRGWYVITIETDPLSSFVCLNRV